MENAKLSFENSIRLAELNAKVHNAINRFVYEGILESQKEAIKEVNKAIFNMAEERGVSVYDICFHFVPVAESISEPRFVETKVDTSVTLTTVIKLIPVQFEFEKGPGYWERKYYNLKEKMQKLIETKD